MARSSQVRRCWVWQGNYFMIRVLTVTAAILLAGSLANADEIRWFAGRYVNVMDGYAYSDPDSMIECSIDRDWTKPPLPQFRHKPAHGSCQHVLRSAANPGFVPFRDGWFINTEPPYAGIIGMQCGATVGQKDGGFWCDWPPYGTTK